MSIRARIGILICGLLALALVLAGRLFQISILEHGRYVAEAKEQQSATREIMPKRGSIYLQDAASGSTLVAAASVERFALSFTPRNVEHKEEFARLIAGLVGADEAKLLANLKRTNADGKVTLYMEPVVHDLTEEKVTEIVSKANELRKQLTGAKPAMLNFDAAQGDKLYSINGMFFIREYARVYPEGDLLGQSLGFVNDKGEGQYGFEGQYDAELKGYGGQVLLERDSHGNLLGEREVVEKKDGSNYQLTIDRNVQHAVEEELAKEVQASEAKSGSVIVMDPKTGEIKAMANYPSYDPNAFRQVGKENINLFTNPSVSAIWEPGSIFKPLVMAAAIDKGLVKKETTETFAASVTVNDYTINTALKKAFGKETMTDVLINSDNVAMVWVGDKLGNQGLNEYLGKMGFGNRTGIDLKGEINGRVLPVNSWGDIHRATMTFGQGIGTTPIQVLTAYTAIANDGKIVKPRLVAASQSDSSAPWVSAPVAYGEQVFKPETASDLREMLQQVVEKGHARAGVTGYEIGGKTGTAQVPNPDGGGYIEDAYNHSFIGMGPANDPKYLMLVKIDQPNIAKVSRFAEGTAVPLFSRISRFLLHYYQIPPSSNR